MNLRPLWIILGIIVVVWFVVQGQRREHWRVPHSANLLCGFETVAPWDTSPEQGFSLKHSREHVTDGQASLEVVYPSGGLPSINTRKLRQEWGEYESLAVDIFNPQKEILSFTIRLDDTGGKRANFEYRLTPQMNHVRISYRAIADKIDARNIGFVVLFLNEPQKRYRLYFDNLRLERSTLIAGLGDAPRMDIQSARKSAGGHVIPVRKAVVLPVPPPVTQGELRVPIAKLQEVPDNRPLISSGVPFGRGQLTDVRQLAFFDKDGAEIPIAARVLAYWPADGSIRSVLVQFHHTIPKIYQYVTMKWGVARTAEDRAVVDPRWDFPQGMIVLPASWLCASEVIGEQVPMGQHLVPLYDQKIDSAFPVVEKVPWTGDLTKDAYYSTPHIFYQLFVRTGELKYFLSARRELLHYREDLLILDGKERGRAKAGTESRYVYLDALADDYFLTGDPRTLEVAGWMADYLKSGFDLKDAFFERAEKRFWTERRFAFIVLGLCNYYEMTGRREYLDLAGQYVDLLYKTQLEWPGRGGFIHNLYSHDPDEGARPDEYGGSPFMTGLLLEGLIAYHRLTGSEAAADSIFRALDWLMQEAVGTSGDAFRYTTADKYKDAAGEPDLNLLVAHGFGYGYRMSGYQREDYLKTGLKVFERGVKDGYLDDRKHFNQNFRSSGHFLAYIKVGYLKEARNEGDSSAAKTAGEPLQPTILIFESFENVVGRFKSATETDLTVDESQVYLNGNSLRAENKFMASNFSFGIDVDEWDIQRFPWLGFSYRIPEGTPVGLRVKTQYGDWICLGGTVNAKCANAGLAQRHQLIDDGQWHELAVDVAKDMGTILPKLKKISTVQFFTDGNARPGQVFWLDDFRIKN